VWNLSAGIVPMLDALKGVESSASDLCQVSKSRAFDSRKGPSPSIFVAEAR